MATATKFHPITGKPLRPIFISKTGREYWPIMGGSETVVEPPAPVLTIPVEPPPPPPAQTFTAEQIAKARQEEKDKLYPELENLKQQVSGFDTWKKQFEEEATKQANLAAEAARAEAEAEAKKKFEESDAKTLLTEAQAEWRTKFESLQQERETERVLFAKEREFNDLKEYATGKVNAALQANEIAPELADFVQGNNKEEIDASLEFVKAKSLQILDAFKNAQTQMRSQMPGVSTAGFATTGPMDTEPGHKTFTNEELAALSPAEYAKHRVALLGAASQGQRGMYGP
jgi:hypothetical protein